MERNRVYHGDCLEVLAGWPEKCVDLTLTSPPYEKARTYGIGFKLTGQDWVDWMLPRVAQMVRVTTGLVCIVCEGQTSNFRYSAAPILLMADLHRAGYNLRKPPIFHRVGIPGSGGPDWLRNDYEFCVCVTPPGRLPHSDNTAMGHPPKWAPGGEMRNRHADGRRVNGQLSKSGGQRRNSAGKNQWGHSINSGATTVDAGGVVRSKGRPPSHFREDSDGCVKGGHARDICVKANPGNTIQEKYTADEVVSLLAEAGDVTHHLVGGGVMGDKICHENEAPFPESLAEFFIRSFCPPGGVVCDPFSGSGTTAAVAAKTGRSWVAIDVRESQVELTNRRTTDSASVAHPLFREVA